MKKQNETNKQQMSLNTAKNSSKNHKKLTLYKVAKDMQGITLIALVVTIIVLLILAGIAINLTIGENGIFSRAEKAANTWRNAETNEQLALGELGEWIGNYLGENENGDQGSNTGTLVEAFKAGEIKVGEYVNYKNPTSGNYTSKANKNGIADQNFTVDTNMQWRVLGLSEDEKHLLLVSNSPIKRGEVTNPNTENNFSGIEEDISKDNYFYMYGAEGAYYADEELKNICSIYKNDLADEARSMKTEDINNLLGLQVIEEGEHAGIYKKSDVEAGNYVSQDAAKSESTHTLGESFTWRQNHNTPASALGLGAAPSTGSAYPLTAYGYLYIDTNSGGPNTNLGVTQTIYDMLFKGTEDYDEKPYWLASSGSFADSSGVDFGPGAVYVGGVLRGDYGMFYSYSNGSVYENGSGFGVRPVVSLKSGVTVDDIQVINGTEDTEKWPEHGFGAIG